MPDRLSVPTAGAMPVARTAVLAEASSLNGARSAGPATAAGEARPPPERGRPPRGGSRSRHPRLPAGGADADRPVRRRPDRRRRRAGGRERRGRIERERRATLAALETLRQRRQARPDTRRPAEPESRAMGQPLRPASHASRSPAARSNLSAPIPRRCTNELLARPANPRPRARRRDRAVPAVHVRTQEPPRACRLPDPGSRGTDHADGVLRDLKGKPVRVSTPGRRCPRNCRRRAAIRIRATGRLPPGKADRGAGAASQETCRHQDHP